MKTINAIIMLGLLAAIVFNTGCASTYNHVRVKDNLYEEAIVAYGTEKQKTLLKEGVSPRKIVEFAPMMKGDGVDGVSVAIKATLNGWNIFAAIRDALVAYTETFKEAPLSSSLALVTDVVTAIATVKLIEDENNDDDGGTTASVDPNALAAGSIVVDGDNKGKLDTNGGTVVIGGDNEGDVHTAAVTEAE